MAADFIAVLVTAIAAAAVLTYLAGRALSSRPVSSIDGRRILRYPKLLRMGGALMSIGLVGLAAAVAALGGPSSRGTVDTVIIGVIVAFIGGLGVYGALEFPFVRIEVREDGILGRSPWRPSRLIAWQAIESVQFSSGAQWFVIRSTGGQAIRAHLYLSGVGELYRALKRHVPAQAWKNLYGPFETRT